MIDHDVIESKVILMQNNIKLLREEIKLDTKEFGNIFRIDSDIIIQYEDGSLPLCSSMQNRMANYFGVSIEFINGAIQEKPSHIKRINSILLRKGLGLDTLSHIPGYNKIQYHKLTLIDKQAGSNSDIPIEDFVRILNLLESSIGKYENNNVNANSPNENEDIDKREK